jgi:hypothetical protein
MADAAHALKARRTALLARCQKMREDRVRAAAFSSARRSESAKLDLLGAGQLLAEHERRGADAIETAWAEIFGSPVTLDVMAARRLRETGIQNERRALSQQASEAAMAFANAEIERDAAQKLFAAAARLCRKREALEESAAKSLEQARARAEELALEDETTEIWSSTP